jgi:hypothetical protein
LQVRVVRVAVEMETQVQEMDLQELLTQAAVVVVVATNRAGQMVVAALVVQGL